MNEDRLVAAAAGLMALALLLVAFAFGYSTARAEIFKDCRNMERTRSGATVYLCTPEKKGETK
jgi:hypothetical protein